MSGLSQPSLQSVRLAPLSVTGLSLSSATGFFAIGGSGKCFLLTNRHVLTGRHQSSGRPMHSSGAVPERLTIEMYAAAPRTWLPVTVPIYTNDGTPRWHEHPRLGASADLAALPLFPPTGTTAHAYDIRKNHPIRIGPTAMVSVVGFPFGASGTGHSAPGHAVWATGFVASEPSEDFGALPVLLIDCRARPGQSGSPVIAYRRGAGIELDSGDFEIGPGVYWRFLGVYSGRIAEDSDLGMVWKLSALLELLDPL